MQRTDVHLQQIASLTYWKALWPFIVFILATGSRLVQYLLHARSWSNYWTKSNVTFQWGSCEFPNSTQYIEASDPTLSLEERASERDGQPMTKRSHCSQMWTEEWELRGLRGGRGGTGRGGAGRRWARCALTCVFPLDACRAGVADAEARHREALVPVHVQKVPGHGELQSVKSHWSGCSREPFEGANRLNCFCLVVVFPWSDCDSYRVVHLKPWVHKSENVFVVTWLQADDVIDHIIHLWSN